jgi:hypothetical protein
VQGLHPTPLRRWLLLLEARCRGWGMLLMRALLWQAAQLLLACEQGVLLSPLLQELHPHPHCLLQPHQPLNSRLHLRSQVPPNLS